MTCLSKRALAGPSLYAALLNRSTLGAALHTARRQTRELSRDRVGALGNFDISWASMILYRNPGARLLDALGGDLQAGPRR
jgi:hypothetical protein